MRTPHRLVAALAGLFLAAGTLTATGPAATATTEEKIQREITINGKEPQENKFFLLGKISPSTGEPVKALLEVKHCRKDADCGSKWTLFKKIKTTKKGRYQQQVSGPKQGFKRVYYRVRTHETPKFYAASSAEIYIYRIF